ncbi:helix-turn-helix transcriptional regulator [Kribbella sp. NPDC059898]|uniref:helix-turn-helix transcriptional regulator n=1 Tax=Kribbella sp. NPDC059898 TaxID=3346995 RepID=UPI00365C4DE1
MDESRTERITAVAALEEPTRRRLYEYVVRRAKPVGRDEAATALRLPRATAAFHLNRLVRDGLLDAVHERRNGRSGPGAGRPSKLYLRSDRHIEVSLPEHRYDLAGQLLATAIEDAETTGDSPRSALNRRARQLGNELAATAGAGPDAVLRVVEAHGFEPRTDGTAIVLGNCPFHTLAEHHTDLVCEMNLCLLDALLTSLKTTDLHAELNPSPGHCCVRLEHQ